MNNREERYRQECEEGHTLLLIEDGNGHRTFTDFPELNLCLEAITAMYEDYREEQGLLREDYDLKELCNWLGALKTVHVFIYDKEIARYKRVMCDEIKSLYVRQIQRLDSDDEFPSPSSQ